MFTFDSSSQNLLYYDAISYDFELKYKAPLIDYKKGPSRYIFTSVLLWPDPFSGPIVFMFPNFH